MKYLFAVILDVHLLLDHRDRLQRRVALTSLALFGSFLLLPPDSFTPKISLPELPAVLLIVVMGVAPEDATDTASNAGVADAAGDTGAADAAGDPGTGDAAVAAVSAAGDNRLLPKHARFARGNCQFTIARRLGGVPAQGGSRGGRLA
jgi:hypothetical protein